MAAGISGGRAGAFVHRIVGDQIRFIAREPAVPGTGDFGRRPSDVPEADFVNEARKVVICPPNVSHRVRSGHAAFGLGQDRLAIHIDTINGTVKGGGHVVPRVGLQHVGRVVAGRFRNGAEAEVQFGLAEDIGEGRTSPIVGSCLVPDEPVKFDVAELGVDPRFLSEVGAEHRSAGTEIHVIVGAVKLQARGVSDHGGSEEGGDEGSECRMTNDDCGMEFGFHKVSFSSCERGGGKGKG